MILFAGGRCCVEKVKPDPLNLFGLYQRREQMSFLLMRNQNKQDILLSRGMSFSILRRITDEKSA